MITEKVHSVEGLAALDADLPAYYFDLVPLFERCEVLRRRPERLELICRNQIKQAAPGEIYLPRETGFFLVIQSCTGAAAEGLASQVNVSLLRHFFGTEPVDDLAVLYRPALREELALEPPAKTPAAVSGEVPVWDHNLALVPGFINMSNIQSGGPGIHVCGLSGTVAGRTLFGQEALAGRSPQERVELDTDALRYGIETARSAASARNAMVVCATVGFETLAWSRGREKVRAALRGGLALHNPRFLLKIDQIPAGTPSSRLAEIAAVARPYVRRVLLQLPDCSPSALKACNLGIAGVSCALPPGLDDSRVEVFAQALSQIAKGQRAVACVEDVDRPGCVRLLCDAGIRFVAMRPTKDTIYAWTPGVECQPQRASKAA